MTAMVQIVMLQRWDINGYDTDVRAMFIFSSVTEMATDTAVIAATTDSAVSAVAADTAVTAMFTLM